MLKSPNKNMFTQINLIKISGLDFNKFYLSPDLYLL